MAKLSEKQIELLRRPNLAIVGTIRPDGTPQLTPTWVDTDGEHVLVNTAEGRWKTRNLRRDPRISVTVVDRDDPYNWVSVTGTAELTHEGAEEHIHRLSHKYRGKDYDSPKDPQRILVRITPKRVSP
ncbi:MAG: PPOX class F420-dependent oxidoreductase [Gaiellaceae bacterium]